MYLVENVYKKERRRKKKKKHKYLLSTKIQNKFVSWKLGKVNFNYSKARKDM